ncbi:hypothetical protein [Kamptonema formosum]|uniref:hypothetical protein n=1 Tax=Kamptonema formosum TaxID=331992 RepID=UPI0003662E2B|nr:hypothetical protein [Oscillatoria sp. PCC 10802]
MGHIPSSSFPDNRRAFSLWLWWGGLIEHRHVVAKIWALEIPGMNPTPQPPPRVRGGGERDGFGGGGLIEHRHVVAKISALEIPGMNPAPQPPPRVRGGGERDGFGGGGFIDIRHVVAKIAGEPAPTNHRHPVSGEAADATHYIYADFEG